MQNIINTILSKGMFKTKKEIIENAWWFNVASLLGLIRPKITFNGKTEPLNYFGFTFAGSSAGKSFSYKEAKKLLNINEDGYIELVKDTLKNNANIELTDKKTVNDYINDMYINISGTEEGLYSRVLALDYADAGSINIINEEILDNAQQSLNMIKELSEGTLSAKTTKHDINKNIKNVFANSLLFGSSLPLKNNIDIYKRLSSSFGSGLYRRSFIVYEDTKDIELVGELKFNSETAENKVTAFKEMILEEYNDRLVSSNNMTLKVLDKEYVQEIFRQLIEMANKDKTDERLGAEHGSLFKILKLAGLHSLFFNNSLDIDNDSLEYAFDYFKRTRDGVRELFKIEPQHKRIYKIIKANQGITKSQILSMDLFNRATMNEDLELLGEECFVNNKILVKSGSKIIKYSIEPLPKTDLKELIISINTEINRGPKAINFEPYEVSINALRDIVSGKRDIDGKEVNAITLCHFKGTRKRENVIKGQNVIAFDIDDGTTLEEAKQIFKEFTYLIYTTKSHQKEKNEKICDRFRIVIPTKTKFFVDNEQHKEMLKNIAELFGLEVFDVSTRNQDRLWFINKNAEVYENNAMLMDVKSFIPETKRAAIAKNSLDNYNPVTNNKKIEGMIKWTIANGYSGNRNNSLFRLFKFIEELEGVDEACHLVQNVNQMLDEQLSDSEINTICRRR